MGRLQISEQFRGANTDFDPDDGADDNDDRLPENRTDQYISLSHISKMRVYKNARGLTYDLGDEYIRSCLWSFGGEFDGIRFCPPKPADAPGDYHSHDPSYQHPSEPGVVCDCQIPVAWFPLITIETHSGDRYLVCPTKEERAKLLGPSPIEEQMRVLEDILSELRYNPDAGSRVSQARERFYKVARLNDDDEAE
jgi:hypothetical protein